MSQFFIDISKPSWWLGVVIVGLLLNLVSSYIRDLIDHAGKSALARQRALGKRARAEIMRTADKIRGNPYSCIFHFMRSISMRQRAHTMFLIGLMTLVVDMTDSNPGIRILGMISGGVSFLVSFQLHRVSSRMEDVACEAVKLKQQKAEHDQLIEVSHDA